MALSFVASLLIRSLRQFRVKATLSQRVLVVADGTLGRALHQMLRETGLRDCVVATPESRPQLYEAIADAAIVLCALDRSTWVLAVSDAARETNVVVTFVRALADQIIVGPTVVPHRSPCLRCYLGGDDSETATRRASAPRTSIACDPLGDSLEDRARYAVAALLVKAEIEAVLRPGGQPDLVAAVCAVTGVVRKVYELFHRLDDCACQAPPTASSPERDARRLELDSYAELATAIGVVNEHGAALRQVDQSHHTEFKTIGILGGGTAGYLAALTLRALRPELEVTVIESSRIPVIGVGEATTSIIVPFLHGILGLDVVDLYRSVRPTFKLGIRFEWGFPGNYHFNYPFDVGRVRETQLHQGNIRDVSVLSVLMDSNKGPLATYGEYMYSLLADVPFAYHLDNKPFIAYLARHAVRAGVRHLDREIVHVVLTADGSEVESLVDKDGAHLAFDLYIDCSGFRSVLLEHKLGSKFIDYSSSLFTDRAVVGTVASDGEVRPYTTAETMEHGWCWNIPMMDENHRGYVFSSAFCSPDQAVAEMRAKNPGLVGDPSTVKFRSGRHDSFFKGNVVGIGNSYGFVEPLESTGIHIIIYACHALARLMPRGRHDQAGKDVLNQMMAKRWDRLRWFLSLHYKFNQRSDSPFWQECRRHTDISGARPLLDLFLQGGPLHLRSPEITQPEHFNFTSFGNDILLFGQGVHDQATLVPPLETRDAVDRRRAAFRSIAQRCLPHRDVLELLLEHPELLHDHIERPSGWVQRFLRSMFTT
jgi:tryptophan 7-halogenase